MTAQDTPPPPPRRRRGKSHKERGYPYGSSAAWERMRQAVFARDGLTCWRCGVDLTTHDRRLKTHATLGHLPGHEADVRPGVVDPDYLRPECRWCNQGAGGRYAQTKRRTPAPPSRQW